ncbi:hypothetical protein RFI_27296, partial [Reticulomyxa filosa]
FFFFFFFFKKKKGGIWNSSDRQRGSKKKGETSESHDNGDDNDNDNDNDEHEHEHEAEPETETKQESEVENDDENENENEHGDDDENSTQIDKIDKEYLKTLVAVQNVPLPRWLTSIYDSLKFPCYYSLELYFVDNDTRPVLKSGESIDITYKESKDIFITSNVHFLFVCLFVCLFIHKFDYFIIVIIYVHIHIYVYIYIYTYIYIYLFICLLCLFVFIKSTRRVYSSDPILIAAKYAENFGQLFKKYCERLMLARS